MKIRPQMLVASALAGVFGLFGGPAAVTSGATKVPSPPAIQRSVSEKKQQEWRRTRVAKTLLRWRGVGLFSCGPRWPIRASKRAVRNKVVARDATTYVQLNTGELLRYPAKVHRTRPMRRMIQRFRREAERRALGQTA